MKLIDKEIEHREAMYELEERRKQPGYKSSSSDIPRIPFESSTYHSQDTNIEEEIEKIDKEKEKVPTQEDNVPE